MHKYSKRPPPSEKVPSTNYPTMPMIGGTPTPLTRLVSETVGGTRGVNGPAPPQEERGDIAPLQRGSIPLTRRADYVVLEWYLPWAFYNTKASGVRILHVFSNLNDANEYAAKHVRRLEEEAKQTPEKDDTENREDWISEKYQSTSKSTRPDGGFEWEVNWINRTIIRVERHACQGKNTPMVAPLIHVNGWHVSDNFQRTTAGEL